MSDFIESVMKREKSVSKNYIINTVYQLLNVIIPLIVLPHLTRSLGAEGLGLYSFNFSIVSYFVLFAAFGSSEYGKREIAYRQDDKSAYSTTFWEVFLLRAVLSAVSLVFYIIFIIFWGREKFALLIFSFKLLNVVLDISWLYMGLEEFSSLSLKFIFAKLVYMFFMFVCIKSPDDVYLYIAGEVFLVSLQYILLWFGLRKHLSKPKKMHPFKHFKSIFMMFLPSLAVQFYTVLDKTMLGLFSNGSYVENAFYDQAQSIIRSCLVVVYSLVMVMSPKISNCFAKGEYEEMKKDLYFSYRYVWFITIVLFVAIDVLSPFLTPLFMGPGFEKTIVLTRICAPMFIIIGLSNVTGMQYFIPCNYIKYHTISLVSGAVLNFILNLILIPRFSSVGASVASVLAETCITVIQFIFMVRIGQLKIRKIFASSGKYVIVGMITGSILITMRTHMTMTWPNLIFLVIFELVSYIILLWLFRDKLVLQYISDLNDRVRTRKEKIEE